MDSCAWVLGIHIGHDRSVAVVQGGRLIGHLAEERMDRVKHSNSAELPKKALRTLVRYLSLDLAKLRAVGISYTNVEISKIIGQLTDEIRDELGQPELDVFGCGHHRAHALSAFHTSGFKDPFVLVADGAGDIVEGRLEAETLYVAEGANAKIVEQRLQDFPSTRIDRRNAFNPAYMLASDGAKSISLGRKYEQFTYMIGFRHGEAGKAMGLASYAPPLFDPVVPSFSGIGFELRFADYLAEIDVWRNKAGLPWHKFVRTKAAEIASLSQIIAEGYVLQSLNNIAKEHGVRNLCLSGGLFLNCLLNHRILETTPFSDLYVIPAAGDDGQSIGAAYHTWLATGNTRVSSEESSPFLGLSYTTDEITAALQHFRLLYRRLPQRLLIERMARDLSEGKVIGLVRGRSESGPRALCHRSILAHPGYTEIRDDLNRIKGREYFRPFAPAVVAEQQFRYFELRARSPYMLLACAVRPEFRTKLAAVTHIDGTARIQAVDKAVDPFVHHLLCAFEQHSGVPVLLNTSFNLAGDPIVESPHDALAAFLGSSLDALILEDFYIESRVPLAAKRLA